jgi:hypothetical protein
MPLPEEFSEWLLQPMTVAYMSYLKELKRSTMEDWAAGLYTAESAEGTAQKNAVALGQIRLIEDLLTLTVEDI